MEPCNHLFFHLCGFIVSVSKVYGSADSHQGHGSHDKQEACHQLILRFGGYENSENKHQNGQKGNNHDDARRDVLIRKKQRCTQGGQEIFDKVKQQVGSFLTFIEIFSPIALILWPFRAKVNEEGVDETRDVHKFKSLFRSQSKPHLFYDSFPSLNRQTHSGSRFQEESS